MNSSKNNQKYECTQCGNCCRWRGYVHVTPNETEQIAEHLGIPHDMFMNKYTRLTEQRTGVSLIENSDGSCVFLKKNTCLIHSVKPDQCKRFPNEWNFEGFLEICKARPIASGPNRPTESVTGF